MWTVEFDNGHEEDFGIKRITQMNPTKEWNIVWNIVYYIETEFNIVEYSFCIADRYQKWPSYKFQELTKLNRKIVQFCEIYTNLFVSLKNSQYFVSYCIALMPILAISRFPDFPISRFPDFPIFPISDYGIRDYLRQYTLRMFSIGLY